MILEHSTQLSGAWLSTIPREYISLLPKTAIDIGIRSRLLMTPYKCGSPMGLCGCGTQVVRDAPFRVIVGDSGAEALRFVGAPGGGPGRGGGGGDGVRGRRHRGGGLAARDCPLCAVPAGLVGTHATQLRVRPQHHSGVPRGRRSPVGRGLHDGAHGQPAVRLVRIRVLVRRRRGGWRPQGHFDFECTTLNYVLPAGRSWPQLSWTGATIQSDEDHKGFEKWWIEAAFLAFGKIRARRSTGSGVITRR
jgi:hypothetical protein